MRETRFTPLKQSFLSCVLLSAIVLYFQTGARGQTIQTLLVAPDSPRWELEGQAKVTEHLGRKCLSLDGAAAVLKDFEMRDAMKPRGMRAHAAEGGLISLRDFCPRNQR